MSAPLVVSVHGVRAGILQPSNEGSFFELDEEYLELPERPVLGQVFEDDPSRPHRTRQGVPPWFGNLLPEGPLRELIAEKAGVHERRSLFLLKLLGADLPGAVVVNGSEADSEELVTPKEPSEADDQLRFSLAGVQMKFSAIRKGRGLTIPTAGLGGDWIVKLPDDRFEGVPENEFSMMEFGRRAGLDVPETQLVDVGEIGNLPEEVSSISGRAFAVRRFDRSDEGRVHIEDFAQVLNIPAHKKYGATNFDTIAKTIHATCGLDDTYKFLRRLVFMVTIGNSDAHAKNWSLMYPDGRSARLAPAYDLVAISYYEAVERRLSRRLALRLAGVNQPEEVGRETFRRFFRRVGLDEAEAESVVADQVQTVRQGWLDLKDTLPPDVLSTSLRSVIDERLESLPLFAEI